MKKRAVLGPLNTVPLPEPPALPELKPHEVPKMTAPPVVEKPKAWRVRDIEVPELLTWLVPALRKKYPHLNEDGVRFWFRAAISDRFALFCRTENVAGMFHMEQNALEPESIMKEHFVRCLDPTPEEEGLFYKFVKDQAIAARCREVRFGDDSDCGINTNVIPAVQTMKTGVSKRQAYTLRLREEE